MKAEMIPGKKAPYICTPLVGKNREEIMKELEAILPKEPDILEWRVDFYKEIDQLSTVLETAEQIAATADLPILFTIRSEKEGGQSISLSEEEKVELLSEVCKKKAVQFIDYEAANDPEHIKLIREVSKNNGVKLVLSYHNFDYTPESAEIIKRLHLAEFYGADIAKAAVMPNSKDDVLRLLALTKEADRVMSIPLITMSMGSIGGVSRILGWVYGSVLTFAVGVQSSAPGQIPIDTLRDVIVSTQESLPDWT
ncbi:3-dehydroquinate dehydratase I [Bacillus sp. OxB-1]|uniref:type I 3-dehydroquinate dehydratase n=1 Tax=Bacillus sp. (strain OxB-1) TaxID=98228 RepID=UPI000582390D|nr:type I 3-dehydroquinate dehydratase [Bacillus sp. OxB-1]BAQ11267.1 3-dehydroquinate dehydratase I [Bacillus sp. OxB-1]